ncbi:MAG: DUF5694 domain-containing protein [Pseudomonadota bacterium]|nr:DUF5694 domain-containing protein [Pseudomonadota bacterium]
MGVWRVIAGVAGLLAAAAAAAAVQPAREAEPVQVMVVGTWHFAGSERDLISFDTDDVRAPRRQRELERLAEVLAEFRPTKIMVERVAPAADLIDPGYADFTPETLLRDANERVQIGYRLAYRLGLPHVYAIDEQPGEGEPSYFPFDRLVAWDREHGAGDLPQRVRARGEAMMREFAEKQARMSIPAMLLEGNAPGHFGGIGAYYELLRIGDTEQQPGAELNAYNYMRNAKIFAKLMRLAEPGDRILVVYGAGHNYWLRHFASETPGFQNVDSRPYLRRAAR